MESDPTTAPVALVEWFFQARRILPWRTPRGVSRDPWQTLLSETMSQQTRLEVVVPRYSEWVEKFPSVARLAAASEDEVLAAWAGLGYYSRARNLHRASRELAERGWPRSSTELRALPGVGPYTAAAVASLCFGERVPMVDGNAIRVLSRVHALSGDPRTGAGARRIADLAKAWIASGDAGEVNEATMELGARVCTPRSPRCGECPAAEICRGLAKGEPERYPTPRARPEKVRVERETLLVLWNGKWLLRRAGKDELLSGLWIPPATGDHSGLAPSGDPLGTVRHSITVHDVRWTVWRGTFRGRTLPEGWIACPEEDLPRHLVSSLVRKVFALRGGSSKRVDLP